jgi:hypothetical protein
VSVTPAQAVARAAKESAHPTANLGGLCDHFVGFAWGLPHSGQVDAASHWKAIPASRKHPGNAADAPSGALVFFNPDHVALSAGGGKVWSTDISRPGKVDLVTIATITSKWKSFIHGVLGWSDPVFPGVADFGKLPPPAPVKKAVVPPAKKAPAVPAKKTVPPKPVAKVPPKPAPFVPIEGIDYAWSGPTPAAMVKAGKRLAGRYLSGGGSKDATAAEIAALHKAGIGVWFVWEGGGQAALGGAAQGTLDARAALKQASALKIPATVPIYFAVDFDAAGTTGAKSKVLAYFAAVAKVLGSARTGIYAGYDVIGWLVAAKTASWFWMTYAWSGGKVHPAAHLYQYSNGVKVGGAEVDLDKALKPVYGAWPPAAAPKPAPVKVTPAPVKKVAPSASPVVVTTTPPTTTGTTGTSTVTVTTTAAPNPGAPGPSVINPGFLSALWAWIRKNILRQA